jgi:TPR repeat protein
MRSLAACYLNGVGVAQDVTQAVRWCRRAAEKGDAASQCNLGVFFSNGTGVAKSVLALMTMFMRPNIIPCRFTQR